MGITSNGVWYVTQKVVDSLRVTCVLHHIASYERYGEDGDFFSFLVGYNKDDDFDSSDNYTDVTAIDESQNQSYV